MIYGYMWEYQFMIHQELTRGRGCRHRRRNSIIHMPISLIMCSGLVPGQKQHFEKRELEGEASRFG